jgi:hypothetical protein
MTGEMDDVMTGEMTGAEMIVGMDEEAGTTMMTGVPITEVVECLIPPSGSTATYALPPPTGHGTAPM